MPKKNDSGNSTNTTKQRPFGTRLRISWICRLVMVLAAVKIGFLASLALTPPVADTAASVARPSVAALPDTLPAPHTTDATGAPHASPVAEGIISVADASPVSAQAEATPAAPARNDIPAASPSPAISVVMAAADQAPLWAEQAVTGQSFVPQDNRKDAGPAPVQDALAQASSRSAVALPRLLGNSVAYAADLPPMPAVVPPAPTIKPLDSPITPQRVVRPDEITPQAPPAPTVSPYVSPDSAAQKQAELNRREQELLALQQQMEARMSELHGLENRLQGMLQDANTTQDSKLKQLVDMYANMKARQAAQALTDMDETIAVKILTGMKSKQSGEILSYMDPKHAARLSEVMTKMQM